MKKAISYLAGTLAVGLFCCTAFAQGAQISGTVTDKTTGRPATGDTVAMLDVQAGMGEVAHATTDARGHYSMNEPGPGPYLIRVTHQGAGYFIAAPQGGGPGDIPVYDVAAKVSGVRIEADVMEAEADNGQLRVDERYFVHNTSSPPVTQWSHRSFEIQLPPGAAITDTGAQRPNGLPTSVKLDPDGPKGRYSFDFPIQPDDGEKDTLFQISYTVPYSGKFAITTQESLPADNVAVLLPKSMTLTSGAGSSFTPVQADPGIQTFLLKNVAPGKALAFTIAGTGSIPREAQNTAPGSPQGEGSQAANGGTPGGGIGTPIDTPDPLSKYKWWILGGLALLLATAAGFLLRKPAVAAMPAAGAAGAIAIPASPGLASSAFHGGKNNALLNALKEELFALESEKLSDTITAKDYAEVKAALETVLKRALKRSS
jgi:hypothetical protein